MKIWQNRGKYPGWDGAMRKCPMMTPLMLRFLKRKKADFFTDFLVVLGIALFSLYGIPRLMSYDMLIDFKGTVWGILLSKSY